MTLRTVILLVLSCATAARTQSVFPVRDDGQARSRTYHVVHYRIQVAFDDSAKSVLGTVATTVVPFFPVLSTLEFDAEGLKVEHVRLGMKDLKFRIEPKKLVIELDRPYSSDDTLTISTEYSAVPKKGLYFVRPDSANPDKPWQIWTQGEDMDNHFWFPCYDFPNDKATSEVIATVRSSYTVLSNGKLVGMKEDKKKGTKTFHWVQSKPHSSYLIMLAAGDYAIIKDRAGKLPVEYYVYPKHVADARECFKQTPDMIQFFSKSIGYPFAWDKYAQVIIADFMFGGMENTSATTLLDDISVYDARARVDSRTTSLIAHELAHQWWGDVVTCKDWRHLWLNESFASYFDLLYHEYSLGRDEFDWMTYGSQQAGINSDLNLGRKPIVSVGSLVTNVYPRGAAVLHMLRFVLGDKLFWRSMHHYITKHQFQPVETDDLKKAVEEATGQNLYWFFDEWVYKAGYPVFDVSYSWSDSAKVVRLSVKQSQTLDSLTGVFRTPVDVEITTASGSMTHRIDVMSKDSVYALPADTKPILVIFDKGNWLLKDLKFGKSQEEWAYQAKSAANPIDRLKGIQELTKGGAASRSVPLLCNISLHDRFWAIRREGINSLAKASDVDSAGKEMIRKTLLEAVTDSKSSVRTAAFQQLSRLQGADIAATFRKAIDDSSYEVTRTAMRYLVKADTAHARPIVDRFLATPSMRNTLANTALTLLGTFDPGAAIGIAFTKVKYGNINPTRLTALDVITKYGKERKDVGELLETLLNDHNTTIRTNAIRALGDIGDEAALPALERIAADKENKSSEAAKTSIEKIRMHQLEK